MPGSTRSTPSSSPNDLPVLYAWADIAREGLRTTVDTSAGFQDDSPTWFRQIEKLTNVKQ